MFRTGNDELEFHLATLIVDLRAISAMSTMSRDVWAHSAHPIVVHAVGVCFGLASILDGDAALRAQELGVAIGKVLPPEGASAASPGGNDAAWKAIRWKQSELAGLLASKTLKPWLLGRTEPF
jgi:hypothetical protein